MESGGSPSQDIVPGNVLYVNIDIAIGLDLRSISINVETSNF